MQRHFWGVLRSLIITFCKFTAEYDGERLLKISQHLVKLSARAVLFLSHNVLLVFVLPTHFSIVSPCQASSLKRHPKQKLLGGINLITQQYLTIELIKWFDVRQCWQFSMLNSSSLIMVKMHKTRYMLMELARTFFVSF